MSQFIATNFVPLLFGGLLVFLLTGFPVAFSLAAAGLAFGFIGMEIGLFPASLLQQRVEWHGEQAGKETHQSQIHRGKSEGVARPRQQYCKHTHADRADGRQTEFDLIP